MRKNFGYFEAQDFLGWGFWDCWRYTGTSKGYL